MLSKSKKGFTLLEIILVITLISILFGIMLVAINPSNILSEIQDNQRETDAMTIYQALEQYALKNNTYPESIKNMTNNSSLYICKTSALNCINSNQINLSSILVPTYLSKILEYSKDTNNSGFYVVKDSNGKIGIGGVRKLDDTTFVKGLESQSFATAPTRLWTPADTTTAIWLDASDTSTITESDGLVSQWNDKSGNGRHVTQSNSNLRPFFSLTGGSNNLPHIFTTSQNKYLLRNTRFDTNGGFVIAVYKKNSNGDNNNNLTRVLDISGTTNANESDKVGFSQGLLISESYTTVSTEWKIAYTSRPGMVKTNSYVSIFGTLSHTGFSPWVATNWGDSKYDLIGSISEIIMLGQIPSNSNIRLLEGYLAWKWGLTGNLPAEHPYKNSAPTIE
jgi:prepilin-type N-terminal cleavage/methylation domain-containing protein